MGWDYDLFGLPDGRQLEVLLRGEQERALIWWTGTPGAATPHERLAAACDGLGLRLVMPLRPGYGRSTPNPGRDVAAGARDIGPLLAGLGVTEAYAMGMSGGGPHSLATAALVPACVAASVVVSPAPRDAAGLDYYAGMGVANQEEWLLADAGEAVVRPFVEQAVTGLVGEAASFTDLYGDCLCAADALALTRPGRQELAAASRAKSFEVGPEGWIEDDIALTTPWGFDLGAVSKRVSFWAGRDDRFVSWRHSAWMHAQVPGSDLHVLGGHGHFTPHDLLLEDLLRDLVRV